MNGPHDTIASIECMGTSKSMAREILMDTPRPTPTRTPFVGTALGFRPFFLLAGLAALILVPPWLWAFAGHPLAVGAFDPLSWHRHEMLFGYTDAVVAGFLLTAVRNWTGLPTPTGWPLGGLALLWLAGRLAPLAVPAWLAGLVDLAFLPALAVALGRPLWRGQNRLNRLFVPLLLAMALANGLVHAQLLGLAQTADAGIRMKLDLTLLLLTWIGGRVIPFFAGNAVPGAAPRRPRWLERGLYGLFLVYIPWHVLAPEQGVGGALSLALAAVQGLRLWNWHHPGIWRLPILWVLFAAYAWLVLGFLLQGIAVWGLYPVDLAVHAFTLGGIGVLTLGMMSRVALGHSGRPLAAAPATHAAYLALNAAAVVRVLLPAALPAWYAAWVDLAGALWVFAFALFLWVYAPILVTPRIDGRPG